ncbi:MAG: hypothetical protein JWP11_1301 [Frankiales bacterium]|nr:hypothetical protein [Frankiales bacterium]
MGSAEARASLQAVNDEHDRRVQLLEQLLGDASIDDNGVEHRGLAWLYPEVKQWPMVRSIGGAGGGKPGSALPFNAEALDFIGGSYWTGESSQDRCTDAELDDVENYQPGFEPTVLGMEDSVRRALKAGPVFRERQALDDILEPMPSVLAAIAFLRSSIVAIAGDDFLFRFVREEASRLATRAASMMLGSRFSAGRSQCPKCYEPQSVISDEDRAVCVNPFCRTAGGMRHCWEWLTTRPEGAAADWRAQWIEVDEPDVRGRGQVTDEKLSRWAEAG